MTNLEVVNGALGPSPVRRIVEVANVDDPHENADARDDLGEEVPKVIDLLL